MPARTIPVVQREPHTNFDIHAKLLVLSHPQAPVGVDQVHYGRIELFLLEVSVADDQR